MKNPKETRHLWESCKEQEPLQEVIRLQQVILRAEVSGCSAVFFFFWREPEGMGLQL